MKLRRTLLVLLFTITLLAGTLSIASAATSTRNGVKYTHPSTSNGSIIVDGIDVSYFQGSNIDYKKVKKAGVDFVIMRIGCTYFKSSFSYTKDSTFETNYKNAKAAGLQVGVYYYSQAKNISEARKEASQVLKWLDDRDLDMPVYYDVEYPSEGRLYKAKLSKSAQTNVALAWLSYIEEHSDYTAGFYSYRSVTDPSWSPKLYISKIESYYPVWMAQYSTDLSYSRKLDMWQYSSTGKVSGISGNVDRNFWYYRDSTDSTTPDTVDIKSCNATLSGTSFSHTGNAIKPDVTVTYGDKTLKKGTDYTVSYMKNVNTGTAYALIRGKGDYSGSLTKSFTIKYRYTPTIKASNKTKYYGNKAFNLGASVNYGVSLSYKSSNTKVATVNSSGKVTIKGEGKTTITITSKATTTCKSVSKKITVTVKPPKEKITSLKKSKYGTFTVKYKKDSKASGYQIKYSTSKKFKSNVSSKTISKNKITKKSIKVYYPKKKYYVKVRAYKVVNGKKIYGPYSPVKSVRVK